MNLPAVICFAKTMREVQAYSCIVAAAAVIFAVIAGACRLGMFAMIVMGGAAHASWYRAVRRFAAHDVLSAVAR